MRVYRVENCSGCGPYRYPGTREMSNAHNNNPQKYPVFYMDIDIDIIQATYYHCGFISIDQLLEWFDGFFTLLSNRGFRVTVWEVEEQYVRIGKKQLCFKREKSSMVEVVEFIDLM